MDDGHVLHISRFVLQYCHISVCNIPFYSMAGHHVSAMMGSSFYSSTKFAVTALTEGLRKELRDIKSNIKITVRCDQSDLCYIYLFQ